MLLSVLSFTFISCESESDSVIDPSYDAPVLSNVTRTMDTIHTVSSDPQIVFTTSATVTGVNPIASVRCKIKLPDNTVLSEISLQDAGNGIYTGNVNINNTVISCLLVGNYKLEYLATDNLGLNSSLVVTTLPLVNAANQAPFVAATNLPDSVVRPATDSTLLTITINGDDPDGICDVNTASFRTIRPNGVELPQIPMSYSGNGLFSFSNYVRFSADPTSYGYFKYYFRVTDNSGLISLEVVDSIKFVSP